MRFCLPFLIFLSSSVIYLTGQTTYNWDDGNLFDSNWGSATNWNPNAVPTSSNNSQLNFGVSLSGTTNNNLTNFLINRMTFAAGLTTGSGTFSVTGNDITIDRLGGTGTTARIYLDTNTTNVSITNNILLDTAGNNTNLQLQGTASTTTLTLSGNISSNTAGGATISLTKFGDYDAILTGNNTFTNRIRIREGALVSQTEDALTSTEIRIREGATLRITTADQTYDQEIRIEGGQTGNVEVVSGRTFTLDGGSTTGIQLDNASSVLEKEGDGTFVTNKVGTGDGNIIVNNGILRVRHNDGLATTNGTTTVNSGGTVEIENNVTIAETLTLSGTGEGNIGALHNRVDNNTWSGDIDLDSNASIGSSSGTLTVSGDIDTDTFTLTVTGNSDTIVSGVISDTGGLTKEGNGTLTLSGNNTYTGDTIITGGTLLLNSSNRINDSSNMQFNGGTFDTGGNSETLGTLTLTSGSTLDMGSGTSTLNFDNSSGTTWSAGTITINNWSGNHTIGGGTDQIFFGNNSSGLTLDQLSQIRFVNPIGLEPGVYEAMILATGEVVAAVPETSTILTGLFLMGLVSFHYYRKIR